MDKNKKKQRNLTFERLIILFLLFVVLGILMYVNPDNKSENNENSICSRIEATPAWVDRNDNIIKYGLISIGESNQEFSDDLTKNIIENKVKFVYNSDCGYCQLQISVFGDENFNKLKEEGLTLDCKE